MMKNKYAAFVLFVIVWLVLWNLADYLYTSVISDGTFQFTAGRDGGIPAAVALVVGYLLFIRNNAD